MLERKPQAEPEGAYVDSLPTCISNSERLHESAATYVAVGIGMMHSIGRVKHLCSEFDSDSLSYVETPIQSQIQIYQTWSPEVVRSTGSEAARGGSRKSRRVVPLVDVSNLLGSAQAIPKLIRGDGVQGCVRSRDSKRCPAAQSGYSIQLPASQNLRPDSILHPFLVLTEWRVGD